MVGASTLQAEDTIVDVEAEPANLINEKNSHPAESPIEPPPSWPELNQDGTPAAPDEEFQRRYYADRFSPESQDSTKACDMQSIKAFGRLANLSIAYYQYDLEKMEKVLEQNEAIFHSILIYTVTNVEKDATVQNAREIDRIMGEKREYSSFFAEQNLDRAVKVTTVVVYYLILPVAFVVSVLSLRLKRQTSLWDVADIAFGLKAYRPLAQFIARIVIAITGGMTLLTPMIILSLADPPMPYRVLTVCLCVIGFSIAAMVIFRPRTTELLGIVGTYTAVLVVYVGSS